MEFLRENLEGTIWISRGNSGMNFRMTIKKNSRKKFGRSFRKSRREFPMKLWKKKSGISFERIPEKKKTQRDLGMPTTGSRCRIEEAQM